MKRLFRILLISFAVVMAVLGVGLWFLSRWLQSPETAALVEQELSKAIKMPLKFRSLNMSLWGGLRADGVAVQDGGTQFLESSKLMASHRLFPLVGGRLVFKEIVIDGPRIVVVQRPDGSWKLPETAKEEKPDKPKSDAPKGQGTPKPKEKEPRVLIERIVVTNGEADFYDKNHKPVLSASGLRLSLKDVREGHLMGRLEIPRLVLHGAFGISDFTAGISNSPEKGFIVPDFRATAGGGTISGGFARKADKPPKFSAKIKIADVDLAAAVTDGNVAGPNLSGLLSANVEVRGTGNDLKKLSGKAGIVLKNGTFKEMELLRTVGSVIGRKELANFEIPQASAEIMIWDGRLNIKPLVVSAPPLGLNATGTARLDGRLDLQANLLADASYVNHNPAVAAQFGEVDSNGMRALPFSVSGTLTKPKHNLQERLTGTKNKDMQRAIMIDAAAGAIIDGLQAKPAKSETETRP